MRFRSGCLRTRSAQPRWCASHAEPVRRPAEHAAGALLRCVLQRLLRQKRSMRRKRRRRRRQLLQPLLLRRAAQWCRSRCAVSRQLRRRCGEWWLRIRPPTEPHTQQALSRCIRPSGRLPLCGAMTRRSVLLLLRPPVLRRRRMRDRMRKWRMRTATGRCRWNGVQAALGRLRAAAAAHLHWHRCEARLHCGEPQDLLLFRLQLRHARARFRWFAGSRRCR